MTELLWLAMSVLLFALVHLWTRPRAHKPADATSETPPPVPAPRVEPRKLPKMSYEEEDADVEATQVSQAATAPVVVVQPPAKKIVYDDDAANDEPTHAGELILLTATAQTDKGLRRKRNEDSLLVREEHGLFVVADGMGGYVGGEIASTLAVDTIGSAFERQTFSGPPHEELPKRASELARAIQMANDAIRHRVDQDKQLEGMGTTICAARFSPKKQRLYVGHVGDSRMYRLRGSELVQVTSDHTMQSELGVGGAASGHLSRALGVWPTVPVDVIVAKPVAGDVYLLCSDGLTKMLGDDDIAAILQKDRPLSEMVEELIAQANERGGKDNITVIVIRVADPLHVSRSAA